MVAMAMALIRKPSVVMFDEPTANLAPKVATQVLDTIASITKDMNLTTVLVEQNAKRALEMGGRLPSCWSAARLSSAGPAGSFSSTRSWGGCTWASKSPEPVPTLTLLYPDLGRGDIMLHAAVSVSHADRGPDVGGEVQAPQPRRRHQPDRGEGEAEASPREAAADAPPPLRRSSRDRQDHDSPDSGREDTRGAQVRLHALAQRQRREGDQHREGAREGIRELLRPEGGGPVQAGDTGRGGRDDEGRADSAQADNGGELEVHQVHPRSATTHRTSSSRSRAGARSSGSSGSARTRWWAT